MKKITIVALVALMLLTAALPASAAIKATSVEIRGAVSENNTAAGGVNVTLGVWNALNFAGFWYDIKDDLKSETLTIENATAPAGILGGSDRTIDENKLIYKTERVTKKYKVVEAKGLFVENGLDQSGAVSSPKTNGTYYAVVGWQAEKYIAVKGKANKLVKQILEQSGTDKKTLTVGETWELGEGYTLTANSIDAKATPRQVWLTFSKDGVKLDDKVSFQNDVYVYSATVAGVQDTPVLVTYVDSVFAGATTDMVQLKYSWLVSTSVTELKGGDKFKNLEVDQASDAFVTLKNVNKNIDLTRDSNVDIMGNMMFKVADSDTLRFYPYVEYVIEGDGVTPPPGPGTPTATVVGTPLKTPVTNVTVTTPPVTETTAVPPVTAAATTPKEEPGFEAVFAIAGLLAVAFLVLRQRK